MNVLLAIDSRKSVAAENLPEISRYLGEHIRRKLNCELTVVDISQKQVLNTARYDALVVTTELWRGEVGTETVEMLNRFQQKSSKRILVVQSYISEDAFIAKIPKIIPAEILENSITFQIGMGVETKLLSPLEKLWWNFSRQSVKTAYSKNQLKEVVAQLAKN